MRDPTLSDSTSVTLCQRPRTDLEEPVDGAAPSFLKGADLPEVLVGRPVGRLVIRRPNDLRAHPSLLSRGLSPSEKQLIQYERHGDCLFERPVLINHENEIIDGYATWILARRQARDSLPCVEFRLTEKESLLRLIQASQYRPWLNSFIRGELALDCEPLLREQARENQSAGGRLKDSSKLTEDTRLDRRKRTAAIAFVSVGSLTKVKEVLKSKNQQLIEAARNGEISIHRAWEYSKLPKYEQEAHLGYRRARKASQTRAARLLSSHDLLAFSRMQTILQSLTVALGSVRKVEQLSDLWPSVDELLQRIQKKFESGGGV